VELLWTERYRTRVQEWVPVVTVTSEDCCLLKKWTFPLQGFLESEEDRDWLRDTVLDAGFDGLEE
jgi:hypothetical protein